MHIGEYVISLIVASFLPLALLGFGVALWKYPPGINGFYGYRTARSSASEEAWLYANRRCGKEMLWIGGGNALLLAAVTVAVILLPEPWKERIFTPSLLACMFLPIAAIFIVVARIESALVRMFPKVK